MTEITNSGGDVKLPAEIQKAIDISKNQIKINEQEVVNIQKIRVAEEYTVRELLKEKKELEKSIESLKVSKKENEAGAIGAEEKVKRLFEEKSRLEDENSILAKKNEELKSWNDNRTERLNSFEASIDVRVGELTKKEEALKIKEETIKKVYSEFKKLIDLI